MGDRGIALINNIKADTCYAATTYITCMNIMTQPQYFTNKAEHEQHNTLWAADTFYVNGQSPAKDGYAGTNGLHWDSVAGPYHMLENLTVTNKVAFEENDKGEILSASFIQPNGTFKATKKK